MISFLRVFLFAFALQCALLASPCTAQSDAPRTFVLNPSVIISVKKACQDKDPAFQPALTRLLRDAGKLLQSEPVSVVEKEQLPPSGNKHDYMSLARYYWPDPQKPDGLPYISRDGEVNPEISLIKDRDNLGRMTSGVHTLALAYYLTGNGLYATHAAKFLRTWFLDPATKMNPNFNFAQAVKGRNDGTPSGLIESRGLANVVDAVGLLGNFAGWRQQDQNGMVDWFKEYLNWLLTSVNGTKEAAATNNHGVWFDVQAGAIALFVGKHGLAKQLVVDARTKRIGRQIEPDGQQPRELARTTSQHYVLFNLQAFFALANLANSVGVDLWSYQSDDGRGIRKALDWVLPFLTGERAWVHQQIKAFDPAGYFPLLLQASSVYGDSRYQEVAAKLKVDENRSDRIHLLLGK